MTEERTKSFLRKSSKGFTSIELIIVILVLSVLTASIIIRNPFAVQDYSSIAADQLIADIRYLQLSAMGKRDSQSITFFLNSGEYSVAGTQKRLPGNIRVESITTANPLSFNSLGEPTTGGEIRLSGNREITVYPSTGKVE